MGLCVIFTHVHLVYLIHRFEVDFKRQNFSALQRGDSLELATRLNAITTDGSWSCIYATRANNVFFESGPAQCPKPSFSFFKRNIELSEALSDIKIRMTYELPLHFQVGIILFVSLQVLLIILTALVVKNQHIAQMNYSNSVFELTREIAHDLRSPISALKVIFKSEKEIDQHSRDLAVSALNRVEEIASGLLDKAKIITLLSDRNVNAVYLAEFKDLRERISSLVDEFKMEHKNLIIKLLASNSDQLKIACETTKLIRILSNSINNSIEANASNITIAVYVQPNSRKLLIKIIDDGSGIPEETLSRLGQEKINSNKKTGSGIGVFNAIKSIKKWGGEIKFSSKMNVGTEVEINLLLI